MKGRLLRADIIKYWKIFHGQCGIEPHDIFCFPTVTTTRGHRYKIAHCTYATECRKRYFSVRHVNLWNSLPDEVVSCSTIFAFKSKLRVALGQLLFDYD